jgi:nucleoside-diphosphate-sugar epimerase
MGHTARELVEALARAVGFAGEIAEGAAGSPRSSDVPWQVADIALARRILGWQPVHDLRSSVELMTGGR